MSRHSPYLPLSPVPKKRMTTTRGGGEIGLRSCAEATVIEDLLEVITPVSGLVKRNLDLIRQLGATATSELEAVEKEEAKVEKDVVEELDKRAAAAKPPRNWKTSSATRKTSRSEPRNGEGAMVYLKKPSKWRGRRRSPWPDTSTTSTASSRI